MRVHIVTILKSFDIITSFSTLNWQNDVDVGRIQTWIFGVCRCTPRPQTTLLYKPFKSNYFYLTAPLSNHRTTMCVSMVCCCSTCFPISVKTISHITSSVGSPTVIVLPTASSSSSILLLKY